MVAVTLCHGKNGQLISCRAQGHAEYAKSGEDIVCSATSILMRTLVLDLDEKAKMNEGLCVVVECEKKGDVSVNVCKYTPKISPYLSFLFGFLKKGFESLSFEYPENVTLEILAVD